MREFYLHELVEFIVDNRKGKAFLGYTYKKIEQLLRHGAQTNAMRYAANKDGKLVGIVCCERDDKDKVLMVY